MLNQSRLSTAEEVAQAIEDYWDATEEFSRDDKGQAAFIAPVGIGLAKGGKPNGVPHNFGKSSGTKGKGKMHKGTAKVWRIGHKEAQSVVVNKNT